MPLLRRAVWLAGALACAASAGCAAARLPDARAQPEEGVTEMTLERAPRANEAVALEVRVGPLPSGARVRIVSDTGEVLGVVAPFGRLQAGGVSAHVVPLPARVIRRGRVRFRLTLDLPGAPPRAPGPSEVEKVSVIYVPVGLA